MHIDLYGMLCRKSPAIGFSGLSRWYGCILGGAH